MTRFLTLLAALFLIAPSVSHAKAMAEISEGASIPVNFAAIDANGKPRNYASIRGKRGTVLVFFRSAKWCPFCQAQLKELRAAQSAIAQKGYTLVAISYDDPTVLAGFAKAQGIGYTLLSDKGSRMIDAFGLRDPQYAPGSFADGVPKASVLVINASGKVLKKMVSSDYKVRPSNAQVIAAVGR
jgi:peroxiredoxin